MMLPFTGPSRGVYVWARLGGEKATWEEEAEIMANCSSAGILIGAGADYTEAEPGWFRVSFALPRPTLLEGLHRIERSMGWGKTWGPVARSESRWKADAFTIAYTKAAAYLYSNVLWTKRSTRY